MANFGKLPEKPNFAHTCNLLSQFLKGKGSLGEINAKLEDKGHETSRPLATTLDLLPCLENTVAAETSKQNEMASTKSISFFTQHMASASSSKPNDDSSNWVDFIRSDKVDPETAQMTIFYAGEVIVLNDFPAEKAKEIMGFAQEASKNGFSSFDSTPSMDSFNAPDLNKCPNPQHLPLHITPIHNASDLPIARKNSLHRFLKKRNERVSARVGPYERENPGLPPKPEQEKKWLDL